MNMYEVNGLKPNKSVPICWKFNGRAWVVIRLFMANRNGRWGDWLVYNTCIKYISIIGCPIISCKFDYGPNMIEGLERLRVEEQRMDQR